jgi:hypothetical protein
MESALSKEAIVSRKSRIRALLALVLLVPLLAACGDVSGVNPNCIIEPETTREVCFED